MGAIEDGDGEPIIDASLTDLIAVERAVLLQRYLVAQGIRTEWSLHALCIACQR